MLTKADIGKIAILRNGKEVLIVGWDKCGHFPVKAYAYGWNEKGIYGKEGSTEYDIVGLRSVTNGN
jgi:hypothetical protein